MRNQPEIRLQGFEGDWKESTLGEFGNIIGGGTPPSRVKAYWGGDIPWFTPAEIQSSGSGLVAESERTITQEGLANSTAKMLPPNSLLLTSRASVGHVAVNSVPVTTNQGFQSVVPFSSDSVWFLYNWALGHKKVLMLEASGSTFVEISGTAVKNVELLAPELDEQQAIGSFFSNLDSTIQETKSQIEKLKNLRSTMLVKMFPQGSSKVPEIRLDGFKGEWNKSRFGQQAEFINGRAYSQPELLTKGRYRVLRVGNFYSNESWYYSDLELADKFYANTGDLLYTWSATFGPRIWEGEKVIYHYHIWKLALFENTDRDFLLIALERDKQEILANTNGSTMAHITKELMEEKEFMIPSHEEQRAIGTFFRELDELIDAEELKLTKLENLKQTFLTKMFV